MVRLRCFLACLAVVIGCRHTLDAPAASCAGTRAFSAPWRELSDSQLRLEIDRACGHVFVGFKEEGAARGVDAQSRSITSATTVSRMTRLLTERGMTLEWQSSDLPHVSARMATPPELVSELRHHPNVEYLEPIFPGTWNVQQ
jgi:hypothetical protein